MAALLAFAAEAHYDADEEIWREVYEIGSGVSIYIGA